MAFYTGYQELPVDSYDSFKNSVIGNGYDADGYYGDQCWDLTAELWYSVGFSTGYPQTGPNQYASECWTVSKAANCVYNGVTYFNTIENLSDIKRGDVVVFDGNSSFPAGHIGLADTDYDGSGTLLILGQNQGDQGTPTPIVNPAGGTTANVTRLPTLNFLGAFRYKEWETPTPSLKKSSNFPWVLYARRLNQQRQNML